MRTSGVHVLLQQRLSAAGSAHCIGVAVGSSCGFLWRFLPGVFDSMLVTMPSDKEGLPEQHVSAGGLFGGVWRCLRPGVAHFVCWQCT